MLISRIFDKIKKKYRETSFFEIDYDNAKNILKKEANTLLIDVRSEQEFCEGHLNGSINIPLYELKKDCSKYLKDKQTTIILYCQSGVRSKKALDFLKEKGYKNLYEIKGGLDEK